ncbi:hypothetical protein PoB_007699300 [Plakobranchus ocellatus]|uniref:Secreted protein n=1 Tax=Plakobranchus ocellatus TaxID=259542 RepID=A0AAV4E1I7_9GAST|nr:hypothetical protein PoB_007699300 [Plakobranchus ocellatus]
MSCYLTLDRRLRILLLFALDPPLVLGSYFADAVLPLRPIPYQISFPALAQNAAAGINFLPNLVPAPYQAAFLDPALTPSLDHSSPCPFCLVPASFP